MRLQILKLHSLNEPMREFIQTDGGMEVISIHIVPFLLNIFCLIKRIKERD